MPLPSYVFPHASIDEMLDLAVDQLSAYLEDPSGDAAGTPTAERLGVLHAQAQAYAAAAGVVGLKAAPRFIVRPGRGTPGDMPVIRTAQAIYGNEEKKGVPFYRIIVDGMGRAEDWAGTVRQPFSFVVDAYADEWQGLLDDGRKTQDAGARLGGALNALLTPIKPVYPLLKTWGFHSPELSIGAAEREGVTLHRPSTFTCDLYYHL